MALACAMHRSHMRAASVAAQTEDAAATCDATASAPVVEHLAPALAIHAVRAHAVENVAPAPVALLAVPTPDIRAAPAPVVEFVALARVITCFEQLLQPSVPQIQEEILDVTQPTPP